MYSSTILLGSLLLCFPVVRSYEDQYQEAYDYEQTEMEDNLDEVEITEDPTFISKSITIEFPPNETEITIDLPCEMTHPRLPELVLIWRREGEVIFSGTVIMLKEEENEGRHRLIESDYGNILKIDPGLPSDAGVYTCEVAGTADDQKISITHVVKDSTEGKSLKEEKQLFGSTDNEGKNAETGRTESSQPLQLDTDSLTSPEKELVQLGEGVNCEFEICLQSQDELIIIEPEESLSAQKGSLKVMQIVAMCVLILVSLAMIIWYINMQRQKKFTYRLAEKHATLPYWRV